MQTAILSIDGGGMKGIVPAVVIHKLETLLQQYSNDTNARIGDYFDLIGGTSTGSILTALYLTPENNHPKYSAKEILDFYLKLGSAIFQKQSLYPLFGSKYINRDFEKTLQNFFGDLKLSQLLKPCLIASYDTTTRSAVFFNAETGRKHKQRNPFVWQAILSSCAAPTYFPPMCLDKPAGCPNCFIDGGVVANNPALCSLIEAFKLKECNSINDVRLMSVGNIQTDISYFYRDVKKWGLIEWAAPLFSILLNSNAQTVDYQLRSIFHIVDKDEQYLRLQFNSVEKSPAIDDYSDSAIEYFLTCGNELAETYSEELNQFAQWLVNEKE
ncbi:patatin-like phospholipase family protein [[Clostridium] polysaccharolyticum]|uniref:Patatin-like phospholipase n=1 Tax=[Clostridium] polysaccharolyticum TaxID=29364 RepID=A0A1I0G9M5_9FIRM|nr:patatin-like phospholipase family protein [[Clostridium] polysaccharolyticum]SET66681.1 Patatin-like phospholipase [[Clostridium] polysaccharolyticum]